MQKTIYTTIAAIGGVAIIGLSIYAASLNGTNDKLTSDLKTSEAKLAKTASDLTEVSNDLVDSKAQSQMLSNDIERVTGQLSDANARLASFQTLDQAADRSRRSIDGVLSGEAKSRRSHFDGVHANTSEYRHYFSEIRQINYESCPADFRDAWKDFLTAVEFKIRHPILSGAVRPSEFPSDKRRNLETIAAKYGVEFHAR